MRVYVFLLLFLCVLGGFFSYRSAVERLCFGSVNMNSADMGEQIAAIERQFATLEPQMHQQEASLKRIYGQLLQTNGRFACKTIISGNASRLLLADVTLRSGRGRSGEAAVSRAYMRNEGNFDITMPSAVTAYELDLAFDGTPLYGLGSSFVEAELKTGINAVFLAAIAVIESDYGNSVLAATKNNLFGFGAYDSNPDSARSFSDKRECVLEVARFLREHYIEGAYYRGHSIAAINELYASDSAWANKVFDAMRHIDHVIRRKCEE